MVGNTFLRLTFSLKISQFVRKDTELSEGKYVLVQRTIVDRTRPPKMKQPLLH